MALVERWQSEMQSFHLPHGEMTITLQDREVIMGIPVDGLMVVGFTSMGDWGDLWVDLLGHRPPGRDVDASENIAVLCFEIYTDCIDALKAVEVSGRLTLDDARVATNTSDPAAGCGQRAGGCRGHGGRQSAQRHTSGWRQTPVHDNTMEEANQLIDEMCLDIGYDMGCDATGPLPSMAHDDAAPTYRSVEMEGGTVAGSLMVVGDGG
nr:serine/threonine-protein phosphatase 7 long form like [Quercus suber]